MDVQRLREQRAETPRLKSHFGGELASAERPDGEWASIVYPLIGAILAGLLGIAFRRSKLSASLMFGAAVLCILAWATGHRADWWAVAAVTISLVVAPIAAIHFAQAFMVGKDGNPRRRPHK